MQLDAPDPDPDPGNSHLTRNASFDSPTLRLHNAATFIPSSLLYLTQSVPFQKGVIAHAAATPEFVVPPGGNEDFNDNPFYDAVLEANVERLNALCTAEQVDDSVQPVWGSGRGPGLGPRRVLLQQVELGTPLLVVAAYHGHVGVVECLLDHGARLDAVDEETGAHAQHVAAYRGHVDVLRLLVERGADLWASLGLPEADAGNYKLRAHRGNRVIHCAAFGGHVDCVQLCLEHGCSPDLRNAFQATPLQLAAIQGHLDVAKLLLASGSTVCEANIRGETPIHLAAFFNKHEVLRHLLSLPDAVELINRPSTDGAKATPLNLACWNPHDESVQLLLDHGADPNIVDKDDDSPLFAASCRGYLGIVRALLAHGADPTLVNKDGISAIDAAVSEGYVEVVQELLDHGSDIHYCGRPGSLLTQVAEIQWQGSAAKMAKLLVERGALLSTGTGLSPLNLASTYGNFSVLWHLLDAQDAPVHLERSAPVVLNYVASAADVNKDAIAVLHKLLEMGVDPVTATNESELTPLHYAISRGDVEMAMALVHHPRAMDLLHARCCKGRLPLDFSFKYAIGLIADAPQPNPATQAVLEHFHEQGKTALLMGLDARFADRDAPIQRSLVRQPHCEFQLVREIFALAFPMSLPESAMSASDVQQFTNSSASITPERLVYLSTVFDNTLPGEFYDGQHDDYA